MHSSFSTTFRSELILKINNFVYKITNNGIILKKSRHIRRHNVVRIPWLVEMLLMQRILTRATAVCKSRLFERELRDELARISRECWLRAGRFCSSIWRFDLQTYRKLGTRSALLHFEAYMSALYQYIIWGAWQKRGAHELLHRGCLNDNGFVKLPWDLLALCQRILGCEWHQ